MVGAGCRRLVAGRGMRPRRVLGGDHGADGLASLVVFEEHALSEKLFMHPGVEIFSNLSD
jgi:hypothetical protein